MDLLTCNWTEVRRYLDAKRALEVGACTSLDDLVSLGTMLVGVSKCNLNKFNPLLF